MNILNLKTFSTNFATLKVRMGDWDLLSLREPLPYVESSVASILVNPGFDPNTVANNIAIVTVTAKFNLGQVPTITTGCLPCSFAKIRILDLI